MNMHAIDWLIVFGLLMFIVGLAFYTRKYTQSVADFLAANRCAGRYVLCISDGIAGVGAISIVACFEMYYAAGRTSAKPICIFFAVPLSRSSRQVLTLSRSAVSVRHCP